MLVLSRMRNEKIVIHCGGEIVGTVTLLEVRGGQARLGLSFPKEYELHRAEVLERIQRESRVAASLKAEERR